MVMEAGGEDGSQWSKISSNREALPIASSTCYEQKAREHDPTRMPAGTRRGAQLCSETHRVWDKDFREWESATWGRAA
jgi:hypothetical protein